VSSWKRGRKEGRKEGEERGGAVRRKVGTHSIWGGGAVPSPPTPLQLF